MLDTVRLDRRRRAADAHVDDGNPVALAAAVRVLRQRVFLRCCATSCARRSSKSCGP
jgi:hypothetical protein